jgi:hypothetical protein
MSAVIDTEPALSVAPGLVAGHPRVRGAASEFNGSRPELTAGAITEGAMAAAINRENIISTCSESEAFTAT